ncbi:uncharacterized protein LOC117628994 [Prunus dulcis]|uniref:uncharacterized protein LOC117628994 n=1 Tax=Prunus dulcis TaxID=3755 RepID=UPI00148328C4|nr:uncharacterized protein LOC117628994 [Prunus dulcis]
MVGWAIWEARNGLLWNNKKSRPEHVSLHASLRLQDFLRVNNCLGSQSRQGQIKQMWQPPHENSLKINVDGAWQPGTTEGGVGVVVRDSTGKFVAGCAIKFTNVFSASQVEALAARTGTILVMERGYQNVVFESDALQIVTALRNHSIDRSVLGPVVEDTKSLLTQITGEGFTHIRRTANGVAHRLARFALHIGGSLY